MSSYSMLVIQFDSLPGRKQRGLGVKVVLER